MDRKINNLKPGQSIRISQSESGYVTAERSGNGKLVRFVRFTYDDWGKDGAWQVIRTRNFSDRS